MTTTDAPTDTVAGVWSAVMDRAGCRCQCQTAGHPHHRTPGRCEAGVTSILIAGPRDPGPYPDRTAATVPATQLQAWCEACWDHAVASSRRRAKRQATLRLRDAEGLW